MSPQVFAGLPLAIRVKAVKKIKIKDIKITHFVSQTKIICCICEYFKISKDDLIGKSRKRNIVMPRQMAMHMIYTITPNSTLKKIGSDFNIDHSTCIYANQTVSDLLDVNKNFKFDYNEVLKML